MTKIELEAWVLAIARRLESNSAIEDDRVEVKSNWVHPGKAARRIAGHANSARGEPILWVIGLDEKAGVVGAERNKFSDWWNQVKAEFDGLSPSVELLNVPVGEKEVVGLLFDTSRFPFVVKNPNGGAVQYEVPWREGTAIRSARREDLIEILAPMQRLPDLELLSASLTVSKRPGERGEYWGTFDSDVYLTPMGEEPLVIPFHRCEVVISIPGISVETKRVYLSPPTSHSAAGSQNRSLTIETSGDELIVRGPGHTFMRCQFGTKQSPPLGVGPINVCAKFTPVHAVIPSTFEVAFGSPSADTVNEYKWKWSRGGTT